MKITNEDDSKPVFYRRVGSSKMWLSSKVAENFFILLTSTEPVTNSPGRNFQPQVVADCQKNLETLSCGEETLADMGEFHAILRELCLKDWLQISISRCEASRDVDPCKFGSICRG